LKISIHGTSGRVQPVSIHGTPGQAQQSAKANQIERNLLVKKHRKTKSTARSPIGRMAVRLLFATKRLCRGGVWLKDAGRGPQESPGSRDIGTSPGSEVKSNSTPIGEKSLKPAPIWDERGCTPLNPAPIWDGV
jgi:hypothetical protein